MERFVLKNLQNEACRLLTMFVRVVLDPDGLFGFITLRLTKVSGGGGVGVGTAGQFLQRSSK